MGNVALLLLLLPAIALGAPTTKCTKYPTQGVQVKQSWMVGGTVAHFLKPGNTTLRGPAVPREYARYSIFINGSFPGPAVRAKVGDWIQVDVSNKLVSTVFTVHWHGIKQAGTPWSDGTGMVNSCPVDIGETQSYVWQATEAGTFFYHGHTGLEDEYGLSGAIIIEDPKDPHRALYDQELADPIMVRDWWFIPDGIFAMGPDYGFYNTLEGALINGAYGDGSDQFPYQVFDLTAGLCYRVRFIMASTEWPGWKAEIAGLNMTIISMDGNVKPVNAKGFTFYIGNRVDAVVCADAPAGDYKLTFSSVLAPSASGPCPPSTCANTTSALFRIKPNTGGAKSTVNRATLKAAATVSVNGGIVDHAKTLPLIKPLKADPPPTKVDQSWTVYVGFGAVAGYAWTERDVPSMLSMTPPQFSQGRCGMAGTLYKTLEKKDMVVDITINNLNSDAHPMHLHMHDFWVLGTKYITEAQDSFGWADQTLCPGQAMSASPVWDDGSAPGFAWGCPYNKARDAALLNTKDPWSTDTVILPPRSWTVIRVKFDNPSWAYLHCHMNNDMLASMGFLINVAPSQQPAIPAWVDTSCSACGTTNQQCGEFSILPAQLPKCRSGTPFCSPLAK